MSARPRRREFADFCLAVYLQQHPPRHLGALQAQLAEAGIEVSLSSLKRYSARYEWQQRVAEVEAAARDRSKTQATESIVAMHERHTQLARALQGAGGSALQRLLSNDSRLAGLGAADISRLIDLGLRSERYALGAATDRRALAVEVWNDAVLSIVALFQEINGEPDMQTRARLFARRLDALVSDQLQGINARTEELE